MSTSAKRSEAYETRFFKSRLWLLAVLALVLARPTDAQLSGAPLVSALREGGYVLVMRHASSPFQAPDKAAADPDNTNLERELDATGKQTSIAMGKALEALSIPIGDVETSRTFRALQTAKYLGLEHPMPVPELTEGKQGMAADENKARAAWLVRAAAKTPRAGTNTVLITHTPNIAAAFGADAKGIAAGETLVLHPDGKGGTALVARVTIDEWPQLAAARR